MIEKLRPFATLFLLLAFVAPAVAQEDTDRHEQLSDPVVDAAQDPTETPLPSDGLVSAIDDPWLKAFVEEVLERNPRVARAQAVAEAAGQRAPQVSALPDPMVGLTLFLLPPQTRVGPQQVAVGVSQRFPWFGKLNLREQAALLDAAAASALVEAIRLELITEAKRIYFDLSFLDDQQRIIGEDRATLQHYEQLAQARYASGVGLGQAVIKIQAEITRADTRLLDIDVRRETLIASANALRDLPARSLVLVGPLPAASPLEDKIENLRIVALSHRPELVAADLRIESAATRIELAKKDYKPDFTVGLNYGFVGQRSDAAGEAFPPEGNGDDNLSLSGAINLPIWRKKLAAGVEERIQRRLVADEEKRALVAQIESGIGDQSSRLPLLYDQLRLYDNVLTVQAEHSLLSAESAYAAGTLSSLDLLDAERVLLNVRIAAARVRADYAIAIARLEGEIAAPLTNLPREEEDR